MSFTEGMWEQALPQSDLQMFIGADQIRNTTGAPTLTLNASGDLSLNLGASSSAVFMVSATDFVRTGRYATTAIDQEQFGTAASQPGPSTVSGTSGPLALQPGYPPLKASQMATLGAIQTGPIPKGFQINSIDVVYLITGAALTSIAVGLTKTVFANNTANAVTSLLTKAQNGLALAIQANPYVINVAVPSPAMLVSADTEALIELDVTTPASSAFRLYGFVLHCSYNLN